MTTIKDSNKLTIYKGKPEDYAFIPLTVTEDSSYNFTNGIIYNDASVYMKNITPGTDLYNLIKDKLMDASAPAIRYNKEDPQNSTISINEGTYNINGYLSNKMLTHIIKLYYIENFKYTLDVSQYTIENGANIDTLTRGDTYMFTITPELTDDAIKNIVVDSQTPPETGGGSGSSGDTSSGETEDPNKKYDIIFSVDENQTLSLTRTGSTNEYKLGGTLIIKYKQSDESIKNDVGTVTNSNTDYTFLISLGLVQRPVIIQKINGYNETTGLWDGEININLNEIASVKYPLKPNTTINCNLNMNISKDVPIFSKHGTRLNSYVADTNYGQDKLNNYIFKLKDIYVPNTDTLKAYFLQSTIGYYGTWDKTVLNVKKYNSTVSGIFIIISDKILSNEYLISSISRTQEPSFTNKFKVGSTGHNNIFTSSLNNNEVVLDGPPIFLYDENDRQTKIIDASTDNYIFNDETYFKYNSGHEFTVGTERNKNIINLNKYKKYMYEYSPDKNNHYCGAQLSNANLSNYEGKIFNVVYEVWSVKIDTIYKDFYNDINIPIKNNNDGYILKAVSPSYNLNEKNDWNTDTGDGTTIILPPQITYIETLTQYKLYSFKLSKTDPTTGVYEYTFED